MVQQQIHNSWPTKSKETVKEVYNAICVRLGDTLHIPEESVQALFNDMKLFPSKSQVSKMLQCARQCSRRNGATDYITFGEFCVFVKEMQNQHPKQQRRPTPPKINNTIKCQNSKCDVFLGGSCNPTTWRVDTAIPELEKQGITFYNPQVSMWAPELVAQEYDAKQAASVLLFVIDSQTRSTVGMIEVAYLVASGRCVVVVAQPYERAQTIMGEVITDREFRDLVNAQKILLDLVKSKGVKVHSNLSTALQCTANILRNSSTNGTSAEEQITCKLRKLREVYDSYGGEMKLVNVLEAFEKLTKRSLEITQLCNYFNTQNGCRTNSTISFEKFCALMAEFSTPDNCEMCTADGRVYYTTIFWKCALLKTRVFIKSVFNNTLVWAAQPFQRQCTTNNNTCSLNNTYVNCLIETPLPEVDVDSIPNSDIFLGGSMSSNYKWRSEIAIPLIKKHGLIYYNPVLRESDECRLEKGCDDDKFVRSNSSDVLEWKGALDKSKVLLLVITNDTRSMTSIILAAFYMGLNKDMVLCVQNLPDECMIGNEKLTKNAIKDYNRARVYITDLANRKQVPVFENITRAVECAIERCKSR
ncbi:uncharacterized protein LOC130442363 isoform X3 [Diorhabda sublineata]|uniref:uncharacterized protein LOC130442363 isoform X3 n=1 Tax=Diorhabda sublineata TaxID=1163346 RepID=UPI0024E0C913|nr:uncharacterized protein LOC130442363 isoform X3 [Diorhabda sublineata]